MVTNPVRMQVMDEADRLLDNSFAEDLEVIFETLPSTRQTLLFSATMTESLNRLKELVPSKPFYWEAPAE
jgi:ATP-dependent RNA helicase DDX49/DBP8